MTSEMDYLKNDITTVYFINCKIVLKDLLHCFRSIYRSIMKNV